MTSVPMNPLNSADATNPAHRAAHRASKLAANRAAVGINRHPGAHFARPAKSRARPPSP